MQFGVETSAPGAFSALNTHTPNTKVLILGGAFGVGLGGLLRTGGDTSHDVAVGSDGTARVTRPLVNLGPDGKSSLDRWVDVISKCAGPAGEQLVSLDETYIVANSDNVHEYVSWSLEGGGVDCMSKQSEKIAIGNIVDNGASSSDPRPGPASDLRFAVDTVLGNQHHVVVIDGHNAPVAGFDLGKLVSCAVSRGKSTLVRVDMDSQSCGADASDFVHLTLAPAAEGSKRYGPHADVLSVVPFPGTESNTNFAVGCAMFLRSETVSLLPRFFTEVGDLEPARESLGRFLAWVASRTRLTACAVPNGVAFPLTTENDLATANKFYAFYADQQSKALGEICPKNRPAPKQSSNESTLRMQMLADRFAAIDKRRGSVKTHAMKAALDLDMLLPLFFEKIKKESEGDENDHSGFTVIGPDGKETRPLPFRFRDADAWNSSKNKPKQHPCYVTTQNVSFGKAPTIADMPQRWHGVRGEFTSKFTGGNYADSGLVVGNLKSKVHASLDGE